MAAKYAFLFPGQGAQAPGMIKDVVEASAEAKKVVEDVSAISGIDMKSLMWETDLAVLSRSDNSQMAIMTASLALIAALKEKGIEPACAMGFSLGEFPALYAAGVLSYEDVIKVVKVRGAIMQKVCEEIAAANEGHAPGMSAIIGLPPEKVVEVTSKIDDAYAANMNSSVQTVISGTFDALDKAEKACAEAGKELGLPRPVRAVRLKVAGPFHSPLMQKAADEFEKAIADVTFNDPKITLFSNVTGKKVETGAEAKKSAVLHLTHPVQWTDEEAVLADLIKAEGADNWKVLEVGPGNVLTGLWGKTAFGAEKAAAAVNSAEGLAAL